MATTRQQLIRTIGENLGGNPSVYAIWLEGADAHGVEDEYSDIDLWLDVEDGQSDAVLNAIRGIAGAIAPLDYDVEIAHPHPQIRQAVLHIEGTPEFMVLDVCIQDHSREIAFLDGYVDQKVKILFDKCGVIRYEEVDWEAFGQRLGQRTEEIKRGFPLALTRVRKEIARGNFLEALDYYHAMLASLVELVRMKHQPTKHDYGLKHIRRDLPEDVVARLEDLYAVSSLQDIETKLGQAVEVFRKISHNPD